MYIVCPGRSDIRRKVKSIRNIATKMIGASVALMILELFQAML